MSDQANNEANEASSLLVMARQLHEQHITAAREEAAQIVAVARAEADRLVNDATAEASSLVTNARNEHDGLQASIEKLREFEGAYRASLTDYLRGLLSEVAPEDEPFEPASVDEAPSQSNAFLAASPAFAANPAFSEEPFVAPTAEEESQPVEPETQPQVAAELTDESSAFEADDDEGFTAADFDSYAEPQPGEDVVLDFPEADETDAPMDETPADDEAVQLPSFDQAPAETEDDTVEALLASEAELKAETDAVPTVDVEQPQNDNSAETLRELLNDLDGTEVDDDGGSSTEGETPSEEQPKFPSFAADDEAVSAEDLNATDVDAPEAENEKPEANHEVEEEPEKKGPFSFFSQK